jgi:probable phosphoglycerate mutase
MTSTQILLVRHGETEWSRSGQHTGLTDVPLTETGEAQARALRPLLAHVSPACVLVSPLSRARRTAELAGLCIDQVEPDLQEWDYGGYEGLTTHEIRERCGDPTWTVFKDGVVPGDTPGETIDQVAARARRVLDRARGLMTESDVVLVAHGHVLRVLAACWLEADPTIGARLLLDAGTLSALGEQHGVTAIALWNTSPTQMPEPSGGR